jgi:hypothetical protein
MRVHVVAVAVLVPVNVRRGSIRDRGTGSDCTGAALGASSTRPHDREMGEPGFVAEPSRDLAANRVELRGAHRSHGSAALAVKVFPLAGSEERVQPGAMAQVYMADDSVSLERLQVPVHRGELGVQAAGDPLCRHRAFGSEQGLEHGPPGRREPQPTLSQCGHGLRQVPECERLGVGGGGQLEVSSVR